MRTPSFHDRSQRGLKIEMTPMIDVVFLLLVFFVWTASFRMVELTLPSEVSISTGSSDSDMLDPPPEDLDFDNIVVRITGDADQIALSMNDEPVENLATLGDRLKKICAIKSDAPVILHPDPTVSYGDVMQVYDLSRISGFDTVQIAARLKQ